MEKISEGALDKRLSKKQILHRSKDFERLLKGGKRVRFESFDVVYGSNDFGYSRVGYIVSKKISKKAVVRNRVKRLFREYFRYNKSLFGSKDIIFICKRNISTWKPDTIEKSIRSSRRFNRDD